MSLSLALQSTERAQKMNALDRANAVRRERAKIKRALLGARSKRESLDMLGDVLMQNPDSIQTATVGELLRACRGCGREQTRKTLTALTMGDTTRIKHLTDTRRGMLIAHLYGG